METSTGTDSQRTVREMERIRADIDRLKCDLQSLGNDVSGAVRHGAERARDFAHDSAEATLRTMRKTKESVEGGVEKHPLISIALAAAAGMAAGAFLMRRNGKCD